MDKADKSIKEVTQDERSDETPFADLCLLHAAAIVSDTLKNIVRQAFCYTYLAIGGPIPHGTLRLHCEPELKQKTVFHRGLFKRGGVTGGGGFHTAVRGTMFVRKGAVTPGPSRECDIAFFVKGRRRSAQQLRDSTVAGRRRRELHRTVIPGDTRMSFPQVKVPRTRTC